MNGGTLNKCGERPAFLSEFAHKILRANGLREGNEYD